MTIFLINNTKSYMNHVVWNDKFKLTGIILLILSVGIYIGKIIISAFLDRKSEKEEDDIIKDNFPENYENYVNYIKKATDNYFDALFKSDD